MRTVRVLPEEPAALAAVYVAMAAELEAYLDQDGLYRNLVVQTPGRTYKPVMTIGLMWDARAAIESEVSSLSSEARAAVETAGRQIDEVRARRRVHYDAKLLREIASLLDSWTWFIDSREHGDDDSVGTYDEEKWIRRRLADLMDHARRDGLDVAALERRLAELDVRLKALFPERF
jgi:hypothetical protein